MVLAETIASIHDLKMHVRECVSHLNLCKKWQNLSVNWAIFWYYSTNMLDIASKLFSHQHHVRKDAYAGAGYSLLRHRNFNDIDCLLSPCLYTSAIFS